MRSILRNTSLAAGAFSFAFALVGCDSGAPTTPATPSTPPSASSTPDAGKGGMEKDGMGKGGMEAGAGPGAAPAVEKPKDEPK